MKDIHLRIDEDLVATSGKVDIEGANIDVADIYIEDKKVELDYKWRVDVEDISIENKSTKKFNILTKEDVNKDRKVYIVDIAMVANKYNIRVSYCIK